MSQEIEKKRFSLFKTLRAVRDSLGEDLAQVVLTFTRTNFYQAANAAIARPTLLVSALLKEKREAAMTDLLAQLNLPSREGRLSWPRRSVIAASRFSFKRALTSSVGLATMALAVW